MGQQTERMKRFRDCIEYIINLLTSMSMQHVPHGQIINIDGTWMLSKSHAVSSISRSHCPFPVPVPAHLDHQLENCCFWRPHMVMGRIRGGICVITQHKQWPLHYHRTHQYPPAAACSGLSQL